MEAEAPYKQGQDPGFYFLIAFTNPDRYMHKENKIDFNYGSSDASLWQSVGKFKEMWVNYKR